MSGDHDTGTLTEADGLVDLTAEERYEINRALDPGQSHRAIWDTAARIVAARVAAARADALDEAANELDSIGHHWSGAPAHEFFELANDLRARAAALRAAVGEGTP
jgi:hypothetical protein